MLRLIPARVSSQTSKQPVRILILPTRTGAALCAASTSWLGRRVLHYEGARLRNCALIGMAAGLAAFFGVSLGGGVMIAPSHNIPHHSFTGCSHSCYAISRSASACAMLSLMHVKMLWTGFVRQLRDDLSYAKQRRACSLLLQGHCSRWRFYTGPAFSSSRSPLLLSWQVGSESESVGLCCPKAFNRTCSNRPASVLRTAHTWRLHVALQGWCAC